MTSARIAAHLDPAELDDFQAAARLLLAHPLVTDRHPSPAALALVRRFEEPLRNELARLFHWRLDVGPTAARLLRRPAHLSTHRPARTRTGRAFSPWAYAFLCLVLAALESAPAQTTISDLADEVARLRAGDPALPVNLTVHDQRRAFVDAVAWLEARGVLSLVDGETDAFLHRGGDALYDVDADAAGHLLVSPPSVLAGVEQAEDFLEEPYPPTPEGEAARTRHRVARRLVMEPAVYYQELPDEERAHARQRRTRLGQELERLLGSALESRAEGLALVDAPAAEPFPAQGAEAHAALLYGGELVAEAGAATDADDGDGDGEGPPAGRAVSSERADAAWGRVTAAYGDRFTAEYRTDPDRLRREAVALLERLDLAGMGPGGQVLVRPALARYRAEVRLPDPLFSGGEA